MKPTIKTKIISLLCLGLLVFALPLVSGCKKAEAQKTGDVTSEVSLVPEASQPDSVASAEEASDTASKDESVVSVLPDVQANESAAEGGQATQPAESTDEGQTSSAADENTPAIYIAALDNYGKTVVNTDQYNEKRYSMRDKNYTKENIVNNQLTIHICHQYSRRDTVWTTEDFKELNAVKVNYRVFDSREDGFVEIISLTFDPSLDVEELIRYCEEIEKYDCVYYVYPEIPMNVD